MAKTNSSFFGPVASVKVAEELIGEVQTPEMGEFNNADSGGCSIGTCTSSCGGTCRNSGSCCVCYRP